jgi:type IV secretion system protein VirB6
MATYIQDTLDLVDGAVATYAQSVFADIGGLIATTIRLGGLVSLAFLAINVIMQWVPLRVTDFAKWGVRYLIILAVATSWGQFLVTSVKVVENAGMDWQPSVMRRRLLQ